MEDFTYAIPKLPLYMGLAYVDGLDLYTVVHLRMMGAWLDLISSQGGQLDLWMVQI